MQFIFIASNIHLPENVLHTYIYFLFATEHLLGREGAEAAECDYLEFLAILQRVGQFLRLTAFARCVPLKLILWE